MNINNLIYMGEINKEEHIILNTMDGVKYNLYTKINNE